MATLSFPLLSVVCLILMHDSGDGDHVPIPKTSGNDSDFIRSSLLWMETCSKIPGLANANNQNSQRRQSRNAPGLLLAQEGLKGSIDSKENRVGGKIAAGGRSELTHEPCDDGRLPEPIVVKKYRIKVLPDDEDPTRHGARFLPNTQSSKSGSRVPGGDDCTVVSKIQDTNTDLKYFIPMPTTDSSKRTSLHRAQRSPETIPTSRPAPPPPEQGIPNTPQPLDYQHRHGAGECSTREGQIHGSHIDMPWVAGFVGGDEALFFGRKDIGFASDEAEILGEEFSGNPPIARSDRSTTIRPAVEGNSSSLITQSTFNQFSLGLQAQNENSSEPSRNESNFLGPSTMPRSTPQVAHTKASGQLGPSSDSRRSLGKAVTQDSDHQAPSIRLSRSSSLSLGPAEFYQTGGKDQFPEKTGFSEDLSLRPEADVPDAVENNPMTRSLNFGDDLYQVDIPNCVGEDTKDISHEGDSSEPGRASFSRMSQTEAIYYELSKLLQSSSVYSEQPEDQSENMNMWAVGQGSAPEETLPPEIKPEALQTKITQLEDEVKEHRKVRRNVRDLEGRVETLEIEVRGIMQKGEAQDRRHLSEELGGLEGKGMGEKEMRIGQSLILEKDELIKRINNIESQVDALEVKDANSRKEIPETQPSEEKQAQSIEEELLGLCHQLIEENEHVNRIEVLEKTSTAQKKSKEGLETCIKRIPPNFNKEIRISETKLAEPKATRNATGGEDLEGHSAQRRSLQEKLRIVSNQRRASTAAIQTLFNIKLATWKDTMEKKSLKADLEKGTKESKASRIYWSQLLHDTAEKVVEWKALRQVQDLIEWAKENEGNQ
ncbi:hypothetical protein B9Z19DRAFT_1176129 [Tuber borchii]|uniref:Uncharacterized protein n=1 Tax=Tuber borchii TaxID=42251 RepID=A0A2T7A7B0_TUBBO|nr:hypothetical protein B9Z19DRAFT_1176129 [Tuber borchii]